MRNRTRIRWSWPQTAAALAMSALASWAPPSMAGALLPSMVGGNLSLGYNTNLLSASRQEISAFQTTDSRYFFIVNRLKDEQGTSGLWGRWDVPSLYKTMKIRIGYTYTMVAHNPVLGHGEWQWELRQKLPSHSLISISAAYSPQIYLRHRLDKNALPGEPRFRPEAYRMTEFKLGYGRDFAGLTVTPAAAYEGRRETTWFRFRDQQRWGVGLSVRVPWGRGLALTPGYEFGSCDGLSRPYVGVDRSYREQVGELQAQATTAFLGGPWAIDAGVKLRFRRYTTNDYLDVSRYRRRDRLYLWSATIARPETRITPFAQIEVAGRQTRLPGGALAPFDENDFHGTLIQTGFRWSIERNP